MGRTAIYTNQAGAFTFAADLPFAGARLVADFDGDGTTDFALQRDGFVRVFRRTPNTLNYAAPVVFAADGEDVLADADQDGDLDIIGSSTVRNNTFTLPDSGGRLQYGQGGAGDGGRAPILSVAGIVREGETPHIRLRNAPGGTAAFLFVGDGMANLPSPILPSVQNYFTGLYLTLGYVAGGTPGQTGTGTVTVDVPVAVPTGAAGSELFLQFLVIDVTLPDLVCYSNGCSMLVGG